MREVAADTLRSYLAPLPDARKSVSLLAFLEVRSALERKLRSQEIASEAFEKAQRDLQGASYRFTVTAISAEVVELAGDLIGRNKLRSLDAIQLSSALLIQDELDQGAKLLFIASDHRLLAAATVEGLATWNPADSPVPPAIPVN